jgi:hypothetical protein
VCTDFVRCWLLLVACIACLDKTGWANQHGSATRYPIEYCFSNAWTSLSAWVMTVDSVSGLFDSSWNRPYKARSWEARARAGRPPSFFHNTNYHPLSSCSASQNTAQGRHSAPINLIDVTREMRKAVATNPTRHPGQLSWARGVGGWAMFCTVMSGPYGRTACPPMPAGSKIPTWLTVSAVYKLY